MKEDVYIFVLKDNIILCVMHLTGLVCSSTYCHVCKVLQILSINNILFRLLAKQIFNLNYIIFKLYALNTYYSSKFEYI